MADFDKFALIRTYVWNKLEPDRIYLFWDNADSGLEGPRAAHLRAALRDAAASVVECGDGRAAQIEAHVRALLNSKLLGKRQGVVEQAWVNGVADGLVFAGLGGHADSGPPPKTKKLAEIPLLHNSRMRLWELMDGSNVIPLEPIWNKGKPDLIFGLPVHERREIDRYGLSDLYEISRLERVDDAYLASPIGLHNLISFPWGIYEAKRAYSDDTTDRTAWYVYIQVARAMTMCAASLEKISEVSRDPEGGAQPVLGFTSIGPKWSLFLCYRYHGEGPTPFWHVSQIWEGNLTHRRDTLQLLAIVDCAKSWATNQFEPWISERLERIYQLPPSLQSAPVVHLSSPMKGTPRPTPIKSPKRSPRKATPPRLIAIRPQEPQPPITGSPRPRRPTANRISMISNSSEEESYGTADEGDDPIYPPLLFPSTTSDDPIYPSLLFSSTTSDLEEGLSLSLARLSFDPGPSSPPDEFLRFQPPNTANSSRRKVPMAPRRVRLSDTPIPGELPV